MDYSKYSFVITGFPRSGTAWISQLLSIKQNSICLHEPETLHASSLAKMFHTYESVGCSSSFPSISKIQINCGKVGIVRRNIEECASSFECKLTDKNASLVPFFRQSLDYIRDCAILINELNEFQFDIDFRSLFKKDEVNIQEALSLWRFCYEEEPTKQEELKIQQICKMNIQTQTLGGL